MVECTIGFSVGIMLATALLHALPEAFESQISNRILFLVMLSGLLAFFLLEKFAILWRSRHHRDISHDRKEARKVGWMILLGDGLHNFTDGILVAAAFLADSNLGLMTGLAIIVHEIPQEIGNFIVLLNAGFSRSHAYFYNLVCSLMAVLGGLLGYLTLEGSMRCIPYVLVFASSGFIYIALSDLVPKMQLQDNFRGAILQTLLVGIGIFTVILMTNHY